MKLLDNIQRDAMDSSGGSYDRKDKINFILNDINELNEDELLEFYEKFQCEFKVIIRKEKLKNLNEQ